MMPKIVPLVKTELLTSAQACLQVCSTHWSPGYSSPEEKKYFFQIQTKNRLFSPALACGALSECSRPQCRLGPGFSKVYEDSGR